MPCELFGKPSNLKAKRNFLHFDEFRQNIRDCFSPNPLWITGSSRWNRIRCVKTISLITKTLNVETGTSKNYTRCVEPFLSKFRYDILLFKRNACDLSSIFIGWMQLSIMDLAKINLFVFETNQFHGKQFLLRSQLRPTLLQLDR